MTQTANIAKTQMSFDANIEAFEKVRKLAEYLATSDSYTKGFEQKDKDGQIIKDEITGKPVINVADVTIALMAGNSLGLNLAESIIIGSKLNQKTYLAILKGRELGFDIATSMEKIYSIPTKNGLISYTGVDIISAKLLQGGIDFKFVKQYAPFYQYISLLNKEELDLDEVLDVNDDVKPNVFVFTLGVTPNDLLQKAKDEGKLIVSRSKIGYYSKLVATRTFPDNRIITVAKRFSTIDAERAGLLPAYNSQGAKLTDGKDNWISNTPQMLDNRCISIVGRIIGADLIQGLYTIDEVRDMKDVKPEDITYEKAD